MLAQREKNYALAREHLECALAAQRRMDDIVNRSDTLNNLGNLCYREKDYDSALRYYQEAVEVCRETAIVEDMIYPICGFAAVELDLKRYDRAVKLYSVFENGLAAIGIELPKEYWGPRAEAHEKMRSALGVGCYDACWAEGKAWTLEQAVDYALCRDAIAAS